MPAFGRPAAVVLRAAEPRLFRWAALGLWSILLAGCPAPYEGADSGADGGADALIGDASGGDASVTPGDKNRLLLRGTVVTPDEVIAPGEVLTDGDLIVCAAASCSGEPGATGATVIDTGGLIYPGLIDAHNHVDYDYLPVWNNPRTYGNHNQWQSSSEYRTAISGPHGDIKAPDGTDGSGACTEASHCATQICAGSRCESLLCEALKYGEIRALIAGTTMIQGTSLRRCADTLIRNADLPYHGLPGGDTVRTNVLGVSTIGNPASIIADFDSGNVKAYVIHLAEGIDETARNEFDALEALGLLLPQVKVIHGTALGPPELQKMADAKMSLVWSPSSNMALYGETNDMVAVWNLNIPVALAPDWTPSGQPNLVGELRVARQLNEQRFGKQWTAQQLVEMVTTRAAEILTFEAHVGRLEPGYRADLLVLGADTRKPYESLIDAALSQVRLVVVGGRALYGDPALMTALTPNEYCETIDICGAGKTLCVKESADSTDKLDQSLGDIVTRLDAAYAPGILELSTCP